MTDIWDIFAKNLREKRRKCGFTQAKLAEKAGVSTHYVAMIEVAHNYPKVEVIARLAQALGIEVYELFLDPNSPALEMKKLHESIINDLKYVIHESIEEAFEKRDRDQKKYK